MKKDLAVKKNLDLLNEFMKYAFENPAILEKIPAEAELVILPINDPELYEYNKRIGDKLLTQRKKVILVKMEQPKRPTPQLELLPS